MKALLWKQIPLINGQVAAAHIYVSDALQARRSLNGQAPRKGGAFWIDNWVIPVEAKHVDEASAFMDFLLDVRSSVSAVLSAIVTSTNRETFALLPKEFQSNTTLSFGGSAQKLRR